MAEPSNARGVTIAVPRHGPLRTARLGAGAARDALGPALSLHETHVWYELDLGAVPPAAAPDSLVVRRADRDEVRLLNEIPATGVRRAIRLLAHGGVLWLAFHDGRPAFSCWTWRGETPLRAARGGWMSLPDEVACLEDSVTAAGSRGRGVAPAAWAVVARAARAEGAAALVTKVGEGNSSSRRAVEKAGFRQVALMRTDRTWPRSQVSLSDAATPVALALQSRLARRW